MTNVQDRQAAGLLIGRGLLGLIFLISGIGKIGRFAAVAGYMASKGLPMSELLLAGTIALEVLGGLSLILGWKARFAAGAFILFLIPTTLIFHPYWSADAASYSNQLNHFLKNLAIMGGMFYVALLGPGRFSVGRGESRIESGALNKQAA